MNVASQGVVDLFVLTHMTQLIHQHVTPRAVLHTLTVNGPVDCSVSDILRLSLPVVEQLCYYLISS